MGGLYHVKAASLMSRTNTLEEKYVGEAKHALKKVGYQYEVGFGWQT